MVYNMGEAKNGQIIVWEYIWCFQSICRVKKHGYRVRYPNVMATIKQRERFQIFVKKFPRSEMGMAKIGQMMIWG